MLSKEHTHTRARAHTHADARWSREGVRVRAYKRTYAIGTPPRRIGTAVVAPVGGESSDDPGGGGGAWGGGQLLFAVCAAL